MATLKIFEKTEDGIYTKYKILGIKFTFTNKKFINSQKLNSFIGDNRKCKKELNFDNLSKEFYRHVGYYPNLKAPKSFNEKLNWIKYNCKNIVKNKIIDKYEFKDYIKEKLGDGYTIPLIKVFNDIDDINFDGLPNKFVIKLTRGGKDKFVRIIKDKTKVNLDKIKYDFKYELALRRRWYQKNLGKNDININEKTPERVIIEEYAEQKDGQLYDYKIHCFLGEPKLIICVKDRNNGKYKIRYYDIDWNPLNIHRDDQKILADFEKPNNYEKMLEISRILSKDFPFVRVDFYEVGDKVYVGEMTFIPLGGFCRFEPVEWDYKLGEWLDLDKIPKEYLKNNEEE